MRAHSIQAQRTLATVQEDEHALVRFKEESKRTLCLGIRSQKFLEFRHLGGEAWRLFCHRWFWSNVSKYKRRFHLANLEFILCFIDLILVILKDGCREWRHWWSPAYIKSSLHTFWRKWSKWVPCVTANNSKLLTSMVVSLFKDREQRYQGNEKDYWPLAVGRRYLGWDYSCLANLWAVGVVRLNPQVMGKLWRVKVL